MCHLPSIVIANYRLYQKRIKMRNFLIPDSPMAATDTITSQSWIDSSVELDGQHALISLDAGLKKVLGTAIHLRWTFAT